MNDFMVLVERAVRPVEAGPKTKTRMREELLVHLTGVYEEELARLGDEPAARAEAVRRFGDPAALTAELQATTTFRDRLDARLNRAFGWRPGESAVRYSARLAGLIALLLVGMYSLVVVIALSANPPMKPWDGLLLRFGVFFLLLGTGTVFAMSLVGSRVRETLHGTGGSPRSAWRAAGYAALFPLLLVAATSGLERLLVPELREVTGPSSTVRSVLTPAGAYLAIALWIVWHARRVDPVARRQAEWASLDIG